MIEHGIYEQLKNNAEIIALAGINVFLGVNDTEARNKFIVFNVVSKQRPLDVSLDEKQKTVTAQIDCFAIDAEIALDIGEAVIALFHGKGFVAGGSTVQVGLLANERADYETDTGLRRVSLDFNFYYH